MKYLIKIISYIVIAGFVMLIGICMAARGCIFR
jgi:hypothetical protein